MSPPPTAKRKWAPKSRGGCGTCKSRHVRCDHVQPRCTPCQKSFRQCQYSSSSSPEPVADPLKIVLWEPSNRSLTIPPCMIPIPNYTGAEMRAFDFFRTRVAIKLGGFFEASFWTVDVLKVAQSEEPVRHAVVALASLSEGMLERGPNELEPFAIKQHTKAISVLNSKMLEDDGQSVEVVLMTCALFVCFEMFQNNYEAALSHMSSGIYVLYNWLSKDRGSPSQSKHLTTQLERIFGRVMLQTILFIDTKPAEWSFVKPEFSPAFPEIPPGFRSVDEARDCLDGCMCSLYHRMLSSQFQGLDDPEIYIDTPPPLTSNPLGDWSNSFGSFITRRKDKLSLREQKVVILLQIQVLTATVLACAGPFNNEMVFDPFESEFSQIVSLAARLINGSTQDEDAPSPFPAFEMGILPHLYLVTSRCRHPSLRRQALYLLRRGPRQEGVWNRDMLANIGERIVALEEFGYEGAVRSGDILPSQRLSVVNARIDSRLRIVTLHCCRQGGVEGVGEVMHEVVKY